MQIRSLYCLSNHSLHGGENNIKYTLITWVIIYSKIHYGHRLQLASSRHRVAGCLFSVKFLFSNF